MSGTRDATTNDGTPVKFIGEIFWTNNNNTSLLIFTKIRKVLVFYNARIFNGLCEWFDGSILQKFILIFIEYSWRSINIFPCLTDPISWIPLILFINNCNKSHSCIRNVWNYNCNSVLVSSAISLHVAIILHITVYLSIYYLFLYHLLHWNCNFYKI